MDYEKQFNIDWLKHHDIDFLYYRKVNRSNYTLHFVANNRIKTITYTVSFLADLPYDEHTMTVKLKGNKQVAMMLLCRKLETVLDMKMDSISWSEL